MSKGMTEGQKARTRAYLDEFKEGNGGCIICQRKATDFHFTPADGESGPELRIYACCTGHSMVSNSDELLENAVTEALPKAQEAIDSKPVLMIVVYTKDGEDIKYVAGDPSQKREPKPKRPPEEYIRSYTDYRKP